jgi:ABC-type cobalamin/Fe3+-siderophores transport system ATPase subunit
VSLWVERGSFTSIVGPSGCGKTTVLKLVSGLLKPTSGEVYVDGKRVEKPLNIVSGKPGLIPDVDALASAGASKGASRFGMGPRPILDMQVVRGCLLRGAP